MIIKTFSIKRISALLLGIILVFILLPAFYYQDDVLVYLSGVRWLMPFILLAFLIGHIDDKLLNKLGNYFVLFIHFPFFCSVGTTVIFVWSFWNKFVLAYHHVNLVYSIFLVLPQSLLFLYYFLVNST